MTYREKLKLEHPDKVKAIFIGGCKGCPHDYGYTSPGKCVRNDKGNVDCAVCWDREVETADEDYICPLEKQSDAPKIDIHKLIDEAMAKKDRSVSLYISEHGVSVTVTPLDEPAHWIERETCDFGRFPYECSNCHHFSSHMSPYCPICGEQMHGKKEAKKDA